MSYPKLPVDSFPGIHSRPWLITSNKTIITRLILHSTVSESFLIAHICDRNLFIRP